MYLCIKIMGNVEIRRTTIYKQNIFQSQNKDLGPTVKQIESNLNLDCNNLF